MSRPIGIFGGTFDPIHFGHLRPALEVLEDLELRELRLIPGRIPPHREVPATAPEVRLEMLRLAVGDQSGFVIDEREMKRGGPSYSVETLLSFRNELGPHVPLCMVVGLDAFLGLGTWHEWEEIPRLAHIVVTHRPGWHVQSENLPGADEAQALLRERKVTEPAALRAAPAGAILLHPVTQLQISATDIRKRITAGRSIRYLVPERVRHYIEDNGLYSRAPRSAWDKLKADE